MFHKGKHSRKKTKLISIAARGNKDISAIDTKCWLLWDKHKSKWLQVKPDQTDEQKSSSNCLLIAAAWKLPGCLKEVAISSSPSISQHMKGRDRFCDYITYIHAHIYVIYMCVTYILNLRRRQRLRSICKSATFKKW